MLWHGEEILNENNWVRYDPVHKAWNNLACSLEQRERCDKSVGQFSAQFRYSDDVGSFQEVAHRLWIWFTFSIYSADKAMKAIFSHAMGTDYE